MVFPGRSWSQVRPAVMLVIAAFLPFLLSQLFPTFSRSLEERLHWEPLQILRDRTGLSPEQDEALKVIVVNDSTLDFLKRHPSFDDVEQISALLLESGFERVLINGFFDLEQAPFESNLGGVQSSLERVRGRIVTGAAILPPNTSNARSRKISSLPDRVFARSFALSDSGMFADEAMTSTPEVLARAGAIAALNSFGAYKAPAGFHVGESHYIPHLSLYAAPWMPLPSESISEVYRSQLLEVLRENEAIYVDFVNFGAVARKVIAAKQFFESGTKKVRTALSSDLKKKLQGGKIALIVPDAYTGGRTINSPSGLAPSYLAVVSLANSAIRNQFLKVWSSASSLHFLCGVAAILISLVLPPSTALITLLGLMLLLAVASILCLLYGSTLLPALFAIAPLILVWSRLALLHFQNTRREKTALGLELATGSLVQKMFIPEKREGHIGPWRFKCLYEPHGALSGDWLQASWHESGVGVVAIGDVVGKGASASLLTASIAALWRDFNRATEPTSERVELFVDRLDVFIKETFRGEQNSTLSLALLHQDRALLYVAGAPPWYKIEGRKKIARVVTPASSPLGIENRTKVKLTETYVRQNDVLIAFTDGVLDGNIARSRFVKRLNAGLEQVDDEDLFCVIEGEIRSMPADAALPDDFTLLMLEYMNPVESVEADDFNEIRVPV